MTKQTTSERTKPAKDIEGNKAEEKPKTPNMDEEYGGQDGPEPTRYGDWEKGGRCTDF